MKATRLDEGVRPSRKRQCGIAALMLTTLAVALPISWFSHQKHVGRRQRQAAEELATTGAVVHPQLYVVNELYKIAARRIFGTDLYFSVRKISGLWTKVDRLRYLPDLESLELYGGQVDDASLAWLADVPELRELRISHAKITDAGLEHLSHLKQLESLSINCCDIDGSGLRWLHSPHELTTLDLSHTHVDDQALTVFRDGTNLRTLNLAATLVSGHGLMHLTNAHKLTRLNLSESSLEGRQLKWIDTFPNLIELNLFGTWIGDEHISPIFQLTTLENLDIRETRISGTSCVKLLEIRSLQKVSYSRNGVTAPTFEGIKNRSP
jgi:hypothetical protein